jgi:hypothetical protein
MLLLSGRSSENSENIASNPMANKDMMFGTRARKIVAFLTLFNLFALSRWHWKSKWARWIVISTRELQTKNCHGCFDNDNDDDDGHDDGHDDGQDYCPSFAHWTQLTTFLAACSLPVWLHGHA